MVGLLLSLFLSAAPPASRASRPPPAPPYAAEIAAAVAATGNIYPVPPERVRAVIRRESAFNPDALSPVGAVGLMQIMPFNATLLGVRAQELRRPRVNILAGTRLLARPAGKRSGPMMRRAHGESRRNGRGRRADLRLRREARSRAPWPGEARPRIAQERLRLRRQ